MIDLSLSACGLRDVWGGGYWLMLSYQEEPSTEIPTSTKSCALHRLLTWGRMNDPKLEVLAWRFDL